LPYWPATFESMHFDLLNIVLHLRTSHWLDENKLSTFVVEEIQSDWHAIGKIDGYHPIIQNSENYLALEEGKIFDAPFIKERHELGIKIAIATAINSGFDQIAFVTSNVHIERYGQDLEGFKLLYDQAIPKSLKKIAKQFECKLSLSRLNIIKPKRSIRFRNGSGWEISDGQNQTIKKSS